MTPWLRRTPPARELGMRALEARIETHTHPDTTPPPAAALLDLDDLSPREIEVLRLMASGKSNQEITEVLSSAVLCSVKSSGSAGPER